MVSLIRRGSGHDLRPGSPAPAASPAPSPPLPETRASSVRRLGWSDYALDPARARAALQSFSVLGGAPFFEADPTLRAIETIASRYGITWGVYGGTARDLLLGEERSPASDLDLIFEGDHPQAAAFKQEVGLELGAAHKLDWAADLSKPRPFGADRGATIDKIGLTNRGDVYDSSGRGLDDLAAGRIHLFPDDFRFSHRPSHAFRALKLLNRYPSLRLSPETTAHIRREMEVARRNGTLARMARYFERLVEAGGSNGRLDLTRLVEAYRAHKRAGRQPVEGDVIEVAITALKMSKQGLHRDRIRRALRDTGLDRAIVEMGLERQLEPLLGDPEKTWADLTGHLNREGRRASLRLAIHALEAEDDQALRAACSRALADLPLEVEPGDRWVQLEAILRRAGLDPEAAAAAVARARDLLTHHRFGREFEDMYALGQVQTIHAPPGPGPIEQVVKGFDPSVARFDPDAPHSMHNRDRYIETRVWDGVVEDALDNRRVVEFHQTSKDESFASLARRGFTEVSRIHVPKSDQFNQLFLARSPDTGEIRYLLTEISGSDRIFHMQMLWRLAIGSDRPDRCRLAEVSGRGLSSEQVETHLHPVRGEVEIYRKYSRALLASNRVPDTVVVGFVNGMRKELIGRHRAAEKFGRLLRMGPDPVQTLKRKIERRADRLPGPAARAYRNAASALDGVFLPEILSGADRRSVFKRQAQVDAVLELEAKLAAVAAAHVRVTELTSLFQDGELKTGSSDRLQRPQQGEFLDQAMFSYKNASGQVKHLLVTRMPYGDLAHTLGKAIVDRDIRQVTVVGTCGGLGEGLAVGDQMLPTRYDGRLHPNDLIRAAVKRDGAARFEEHPFAKTATVRSPLVETEAVVKALTAAGYDSVEMEAKHFAEALAGQSVRLSVLHIVSDLPGTDQTLESHVDDRGVTASFHAFADRLVEHLGIEELVPLDGDAALEGRFERAWRVVEEMLPPISWAPSTRSCATT